MGVIKKTILAIIIIAGVLSLTREFRNVGLKAELILFAVFLLSTLFLWRWAAGYLPQIGKLHATLLMMAFTLVFVGTIDYAMADALNVSLVEIVRTTVRQSPWFYFVTFAASILKIFLWRWLFSGVREKNAARVAKEASV